MINLLGCVTRETLVTHSSISHNESRNVSMYKSHDLTYY